MVFVRYCGPTTSPTAHPLEMMSSQSCAGTDGGTPPAAVLVELQATGSAALGAATTAATTRLCVQLPPSVQAWRAVWPDGRQESRVRQDTMDNQLDQRRFDFALRVPCLEATANYFETD